MVHGFGVIVILSSIPGPGSTDSDSMKTELVVFEQYGKKNKISLNMDSGIKKSTPTNLMKGSVQNSLKVTQINSHWNKAGGYNNQNIVMIITKMKILPYILIYKSMMYSVTQ